MLDKILEHQIVIPESLKKIHFKFPPAPHAGRLVATVQGLTKSYDGDRKVLDNLDLVLENGERLVVAGHNGAGKTTLLRIIAGDDSNFSGEVKLGAGVKIGYFSQDNAERLKGSQTVLEAVEEDAPLELIPKLRDMLGAFLFRGDDVFKSLDVLSGGEKSRVALLKLLLRPVNFLILDEPTNHLDMHSKDVLLSALRDFGGTVIFVSHDRGFIEDLSTRVLELKPGKYRLFRGDYRYYRERLEREEAGLEPAGTEQNRLPENKAGGAEGNSAEKSAPVSSGKASWEEQKKLDAQKRKMERAVTALEEEILATEEKKTVLENSMANPDVYSNAVKAKAVQKEIDELNSKLDELNKQWEEAAEALEAL